MKEALMVRWPVGLLLGMVMIGPLGVYAAERGKAGLPPQVLTDQPAEHGELTWLERGLSNGVVARRKFVQQGEVVREIQYQFKPGTTLEARAAKSPATLAEYSTVVKEYEGGRLVRTLLYDTVRELYAYSTVRYGSDGQKTAEISFSPEGVRRVEQRFRAGDKRRDQLQFDAQTGKRLLCFDGRVPADIDLAEGWGEASGGLKYGVAVSASSPDVVVCTVKNVSDTEIEVPRDTLARQVRMELTDAEGNLVKYNEKSFEISGRATVGGIGKLTPGHGKSEFYRLADWYGKLQPGTYKLRLLRLGADGKHSLVSKTLPVVIPVPTVAIVAMKDRMRLEFPGQTTIDVLADKVVHKSAMQSGGGAFAGGGETRIVEGVEVRMTPGKATFAVGEKIWKATLEGGNVVIGNLRAKGVDVKLREGTVDVATSFSAGGT
jgi:hypothetical protein